MRKTLTFALLASIIAVSPAAALDGTLKTQSGTVFVFKDEASHDEALSLISAGVHRTNPALLLPLLSCIAKNGDSAITTSFGFATHDILVTSGAQAGCRGNIAVEDFQSGR